MDVIIVGAGAAGLMVAKKLSESGLAVCVLEARDRLGGRICTVADQGHLSVSAEGGAEFIHGNLKTTLALLSEAQISKQEINGNYWHVENNNWTQKNDFFDNAEIVIQHLQELKEDLSIADFLDHFFNEEKYINLRKSFTSYVEGYYSGDTRSASAKSFLAEWLSEDEQQYRPAGGYGQMIKYLAESSTKAGATMELSSVVKQIKWQKGKVEITDNQQRKFTASKAVITVPLGVWTADESAQAAIQYYPDLWAKKDAAKLMGFGAAIKILLWFEDMFWQEEEIIRKVKADTRHMQMALSDLTIPTWWTQLPQQIPLLTGWLSGPQAEKMKHEMDENIIEQSIYSLGKIFSIDANILKAKLKWSKVFNWTNDPFALGSYSYSTLNKSLVQHTISEPVENTLFFAGEALYIGNETGTVEAALESGIHTAAKILAGL